MSIPVCRWVVGPVVGVSSGEGEGVMVEVVPPIKHLVISNKHTMAISFGSDDTGFARIQLLIMGGEGKEVGAYLHHLLQKSGRDTVVVDLKETPALTSLPYLLHQLSPGPSLGEINERDGVLMSEGVMGHFWSLLRWPYVGARNVCEASLRQYLRYLPHRLSR